MKKMILASSLLFGMGCGGTGGTGTDPTPTDCTELVVLSDEAISTNSGVLPAESCWLVDSDFKLTRALTVKEGVVIELAQDVRFLVTTDGSLTVEGTEAKPVFFTGTEETQGFWHGIQVDSKSASNSFDHVVLEFAGSKQFTGAPFTKGAIYIDDAQLSISNSVLRKNAGSAFVFIGDSTVALETTEVSGNEIAGTLAADLLGQIADTNTWADNTDASVNLGTGGFASGNKIITDQTWLDIGTSLKLKSGMSISANLVVSPNVTMLMGQEAEVLVKDDGSFNLVGTADERISLLGTNETEGFWKGIQFDSKNSANVFDFVTISHAGGDTWNGADDSSGAIYLEPESKLVMTNSEISMSGGFALTARDDGDIAGFAANTIKDNLLALNLHPGQLGSLAGTTVYENNMEPFISVPAGTIKVNTLFKKQMTPFRIIEKVKLTADLQIEPGAVFEFGENGSIRIEADGSMNAEGTEADKIIFTGADETAGFWQGLEYESTSSQNILKHVEISFGGSDQWTGVMDSEANIFLDGARVAISDSKIGDSAGYAIYTSGDSEIAGCTNVDFSGNTKGEIFDPTSKLVSACP